MANSSLKNIFGQELTGWKIETGYFLSLIGGPPLCYRDDDFRDHLIVTQDIHALDTLSLDVSARERRNPGSELYGQDLIILHNGVDSFFSLEEGHNAPRRMFFPPKRIDEILKTPKKIIWSLGYFKP